ncbi:helix-turn-helix domain-containing protein [Aureimonas leprariae]|uniref:Helix-turn-helix domain-containing protein n=1 Tax=Plantimonas leprariae TaxID=2615207 RepID=A0A7V7TZH5_9HYPH|nr:helix-turn-helix domain-containing protein [Aureimonas leprariae]KAB0679377.1 helix-turn-helix domain-containing protein [Aureimonas leprariae]
MSTASEPAADTMNAPLLPLESFFVPGNDFIVSTSQTVCAMPASHTHSQVELNYLLEGEMTYLHGGREATLAIGDLALFWGAIAHRTVRVSPGARYVCIYLPLEMFLNAKLTEPFRSGVLAGGMLVGADPAQFDAARFQRLVEDAKGLPDDARVAELLVAEVLLILRRLDVTGWRDLLAGQHPAGRMAEGVMPETVIEMARFIAENGHRAISVADVAKAAKLHPNYAMTRFRNALGLTVGSYILRHRLMAAQSLLVSTKKDLAALAFETGFGSVSQFHRSFRAHFGTTPAEYRRRMRLPTGAAIPSGT